MPTFTAYLPLKIMKLSIFGLLLCVLMDPKVIKGAPLYQKGERPQFYSVLKSGSTESIDKELEVLSSSAIAEKGAYMGTLLMKKADLVGSAKEKLGLFKAGRKKLEAAMANDSANVEYRFLRLIIEEHAPKVVKYRAHLQEDSKYIQERFGKLPLAVRNAVIDYSKTSKVLQRESLKFEAE
jgi:hypothetical protein